MKVRRVNQSRPDSGGSDSSGLPGEGYIIGGRRVERKDRDEGSYGKRGAGSAEYVWELLKRLASQKDQAGNIELFRVLDGDGSGKTDADEILTSLANNRDIKLDYDEVEVFRDQVQSMDADRDGEVNVAEFISALQGEDTTGAFFGVLERRAAEGLLKHKVPLVQTWPTQGRASDDSARERLAARCVLAPLAPRLRPTLTLLSVVCAAPAAAVWTNCIVIQRISSLSMTLKGQGTYPRQHHPPPHPMLTLVRWHFCRRDFTKR